MTDCSCILYFEQPTDLDDGQTISHAHSLYLGCANCHRQYFLPLKLVPKAYYDPMWISFGEMDLRESTFQIISTQVPHLLPDFLASIEGEFFGNTGADIEKSPKSLAPLVRKIITTIPYADWSVILTSTLLSERQFWADHVKKFHSFRSRKIDVEL